jgi:hypothetical protein
MLWAAWWPDSRPAGEAGTPWAAWWPDREVIRPEAGDERAGFEQQKNDPLRSARAQEGRRKEHARSVMTNRLFRMPRN